MKESSTAPPASPRGTRKPINWPPGITIGFRQIYDNQVHRIYLLVQAKKDSTARTFYFHEGNYQEKRLAALQFLSEERSYTKIPSTWLDAVADTHQGFLEQTFIICEKIPVDHYYYKHA